MFWFLQAKILGKTSELVDGNRRFKQLMTLVDLPSSQKHHYKLICPLYDFKLTEVIE